MQKKLAEEVKGLDLVLSAHSHQTVNGKVNNVPVLQAYCYGRAIGHVKIDVDKKKLPIPLFYLHRIGEDSVVACSIIWYNQRKKT